MSSEVNATLDPEKTGYVPPQTDIAPRGVVPVAPDHDVQSPEDSLASESKLRMWEKRAERLMGVEARGIRRVLPIEQTPQTTLSFMQIVLMWFSINSAANNITLAMLGPSIYQLGFVDAALCACLGGFVGSFAPAYTATWGPVSGNRTMVMIRYIMGWWPTKLCILLNLVILLGYAMIDAVVAGQILSAVSVNGSLTVVVGIIVVAIITWVVTTFGITVFHYYERYAWLPQWAVLLILVGTAGSRFNTETESVGDSRTIIGSRLSFFSICLSAAITYAPGAADFLVYCDPKTTNRAKVFAATVIGLSLSFSFMFMIGVGLASGVNNDPDWEEAGAGSGALIVAGYNQLGGFGKFCSVIVALGLIANMVPPVYSSGIDFQILGRYPALVPRFIWNTFGTIVFAVCALAGRDNLALIFTNFLALLGYFVAIMLAIALEEQFIFRRRKSPAFVFSDWDKKDRLPIGVAALVAFLVGWAGSILCMAQVYYTGPIARTVGENGADMGNYVGFTWAALVYPSLRYLELKRVGR